MGVDRKEQILAAAYDILGAEGLEGLHARSVAAKVGINHAAVHYYYPRRSDLLLAVTNYVLARFVEDRHKVLSGARSIAERVDAHLAQVEAYCKPTSKLMRNWVSLFVASTVDQAIRAELVRHLREWAISLHLVLQEGARTGVVRKTSPFANPELLACNLLGLIVFAQTIGGEFDAAGKLDLISGSVLTVPG